MRRRPWIVAALAFYVGCVVGANALLTYVGTIPVGFGLVAPAGVLLAGLSFTARDLVQTTAGRTRWRRLMPLAIAVGAAISAAMSTRFAIASGATFAVSETFDWICFSLALRYGFSRSLAFSSVVAEVIDSVMFLELAFGSLTLLPGQIVGKSWAMVGSLIVLWPLRRRLTRLATSDRQVSWSTESVAFPGTTGS